jgi:hypothetical protein
MAPRLAVKFLVQFLSGIQHLCYIYSHTPERSARQTARSPQGTKEGRDFFVFLFGFAVTH